MEIYKGHFYHIFNRSNNNELVFKSPENYLFFLKKYRKYFSGYVTTLSYCLMPTHFHFLVLIESTDIKRVRSGFGFLLSSYTKALNKTLKRHGSLFQQHTKAILVQDETQLLLTSAYIHNNPVRAGLVKSAEEWEYSSYREYIGLRNGTLPDTKLLLSKFPSIEDFVAFSKQDFNNDEHNAVWGKKM